MAEQNTKSNIEKSGKPDNAKTRGRISSRRDRTKTENLSYNKVLEDEETNKKECLPQEMEWEWDEEIDVELPSEILDPPIQKRTLKSQLAELLYVLGFSAEVAVVRILRAIKNFILNMIVVFLAVIELVGKKIWRGAKKIILDTTMGLKHTFNAVRKLPEISKNKKEESENTDSTQGVYRYITSGAKKHGHLLLGTIRVVMPIICLVVFSFTVYSMLSMKYALDVTINNTNIGYVENEAVLEEGLNLLRMRLSLGKGQEASQWEVEPKLSVGTTKDTLTTTQVADKILETSTQQIQKGYGIYVDGNLVGATDNSTEINNFLEEKKIPYYNDELYPNAEVSFVRDVKVSQGEEVFLADSIKDVSTLKEQLERDISPEETHTVEEGETIKEIAYKEKVLYSDLIARNPELEGKKEDYKPEPGRVLVLNYAQPYLQVQTVYRKTQEEVIKYETIEEETDERAIGTRTRTQRGKDGLQEAVYEVTIIDGEEVSSVKLDELTVVLQEATPEIYEVGTNETSAFYTGEIPANIVGAGNYIWPVPGYSYSSRGFLASHGGIDINAAIGTPIYASNAGVVTFAGMGTGSYWSYGNFVQIQHPDGMVTRYAHCSSVVVSAGQTVSQGQLIAYVGSTGLSSGPHCHFETVTSAGRVNPYGYVSAP